MSTVPPIQVVVRVRPFLSHELPDQDLMSINGSNISVIVQKQQKCFEFDSIAQDVSQSQFFSSYATQYIDLALMGYNATIFTYGQTGSGKTYTIDGLEYTLNKDKTDPERYGLIPRALDYLFSKRTEHQKITISFYQLYNENVYDLFGYMGENGETVNLQYEERSLRVRWNGKKEFFIENLFNFECTDVKQAMNWFLTGVKNKHMASHRLNHSSSRSHCTFEITIEQQKAVEEDEEAQTIISKLTLVDLAGSEKLQHYRHSDLMKESININRSLLTLGKCISALTSGKDHHVPYRESQLTKLLKHSLGGNCFTMIVACVSPSDSFVDENVNTLYYASRARKIKNDPVVNEDAQQKLIRKLKLEIRDLRAENASLQQLVDIGPERVVLKENDSVARPDANSRDTSFLQEKVVASVSMLQKLSTMNKTLRESFDDLEQSHQKLQGQNKDLELENQSLRERIEILESLLDGPPVYQQRQYEHAVNDRTPEPLLRATAPVPKKKQLPRLRPSTSHSTPTKMRSPSNRQKSTPTPDRNSYAERRQSRTPFQSDKPERPPPRGYDLSRFNTDSSTDRDEIANMFMSMYRTN